ncbi:Surface protein Rib [Lactococcus sp. DD01]|nr:Surface protein Rib [Lactococcus sp. DD01]
MKNKRSHKLVRLACVSILVTATLMNQPVSQGQTVSTNVGVGKSLVCTTPDQNPNNLGFGSNPQNGKFYSWENAFDSGDFTGAIDKNVTRDHVLNVVGLPGQDTSNDGPNDIGTVKYNWSEKDFTGSEDYEGWTLKSGSEQKKFTIVEPHLPELVKENPNATSTEIKLGYSGKVYEASNTNGYGKKILGIVKPANNTTGGDYSIGLASPNHGYRASNSTRFLELGEEGTEIISKEIAVNPNSIVRFHYSFKSAYGSANNTTGGESGIGYLVDQNGNKITAMDGKTSDLSASGNGIQGYTDAGAMYQIPSDVTSVRMVLKAGNKSTVVSDLPNENNRGYIFDNVGLEVGPSINLYQTLTRVSSSGQKVESNYGADKPYKRGDTLNYSLVVKNEGAINSDDMTWEIVVPEGLTLESTLPSNITYDTNTRTIKVNVGILRASNQNKVSFNFKVDNDIQKSGVVFEATAKYKVEDYFYGANLTVKDSRTQLETCPAGLDQPIYIDSTPDKDKYQPGVGSIEVPKDTPITEDDVKDKVTIPAGSGGTITNVGTIPDTSTAGDKGTVQVTVTYPDGTTDIVEVPVNVTDVPTTPDDDKSNGTKGDQTQSASNSANSENKKQTQSSGELFGTSNKKSTNSKGLLPSTGENMSSKLLLLTGIGLLFAVFAMILRRVKRKNQ